MSDEAMFLIIKKHIDRMDYSALLAGGAPKDEFDIESKEICKRIFYEQSAQEIAQVVASVFNASFDANEKHTLFLPVAEQIKKEIDLLA